MSLRQTFWIASAALLVLGAVVALGGFGTYLFFDRDESRWTTESPRALEEFEAGFDDLMKHYCREAQEHFDRALELDPDFAVAKLSKLYCRGGLEMEERQKIREELRAYDTSRLEPHERFLIEYWLARTAHESERASEILERFAEKYPDDVVTLDALCDEAWQREDWPEAERCYQKMIELYPNWVDAQNRLGLISMAQGRFDQAEERFETYRFIAPDQAVPHDAMGQLLTLRGRYEEAEEAFQRAIGVKADFCETYYHLIRLYGMWGRFEAGEKTLDQVLAIDTCPYAEKDLACSVHVRYAYEQGDFDEAWRVYSEECEGAKSLQLFVHRVAVLTGRFTEAVALEEGILETHGGEAGELGLPEHVRAFYDHMVGVRHLAQGDVAVAVEKLSAADAILTYWEREQGNFKQFNRMNLVRALERAGEGDEARRIYDEVKAVNPRFGMKPEIAELDPLAAWTGPGGS